MTQEAQLREAARALTKIADELKLLRKAAEAIHAGLERIHAGLERDREPIVRIEAHTKPSAEALRDMLGQAEQLDADSFGAERRARELP